MRLLSFLMLLALLGCGDSKKASRVGVDAGVDGGNGDAGTPGIESSEPPFSYFLKPTDQLAIQDSPEGFQLTHDAALNSWAGEVDFYIGEYFVRIDQPIRTLREGYLPVFLFEEEYDDVMYRFEAVAVTHDMDPRENLVARVRVTITNESELFRDSGFSAAFMPRRNNTRHELTAPQWFRDKFYDVNKYSTTAEASVGDRYFVKNGHIITEYLSSVGPAVEKVNGDVIEGQWSFKLMPGETQVIELAVPYVPVSDENTQELARLTALPFDAAVDLTAVTWMDRLNAGTTFTIPEKKVEYTSKASLIYDLMARDIDESGLFFVQKVNEFQYDAFFPRDAAYFAYTYDLLGHHQIAGEVIEHFLKKNGLGTPIELRRIYPDDWGQSLWAIGSHFQRSGDMAFANRFAPFLAAHRTEFLNEIAGDPKGLWPVAGPYDNEALNNEHYTGHSFWALLGLKEGKRVAEAVGDTTLANNYQATYDTYRATFMGELDAITARTGGYIPPGIDNELNGYDWANASGGLYPFRELAPDDPRVAATAWTVREHKYQEGIMTYGVSNAYVRQQALLDDEPVGTGSLHHYQTIYTTMTNLLIGEQRAVIEDLYGLLVHTSSTHAGFEYGIPAWGNRDPRGNRPPHGWFAARYNELLRNMLLREEGSELHLLSAMSPAWTGDGETLAVNNGATYFGPVDYVMEFVDGGATFTFEPTFNSVPDKVWVHVPWFAENVSAKVDGNAAAIVDGKVELPASKSTLKFSWDLSTAPALSYDEAVGHYLRKWTERPEDEDYEFLFPTPRAPRFRDTPRLFTSGSVQAELYVPGGLGTIHYTTDGSTPTTGSAVYGGAINVSDTVEIQAIAVYQGVTRGPVGAKFEKVVPRAADNPGATDFGLAYEYFAGEYSDLPDFDMEGVPDATGKASVPALNSVATTLDDQFAIRFTGFLEVPADGVYTLSTASDDGSQLVVGDTLVVDNGGPHARQEIAGEIALAQGKHEITVTFFEAGGGARSLDVYWESPTITKALIPATAFSHVP